MLFGVFLIFKRPDLVSARTIGMQFLLIGFVSAILLIRKEPDPTVFVRDSITREIAHRDSIARRDSIVRALAVQDSLARAKRIADSLAAFAHDDSLHGEGANMPRIEGDPNIQVPTAGLQLTFVDQVWDTYQQVQFSYARPFAKRKASWEIDLPFQHWDSVSSTKTATSVANVTFNVNRVISSADAGWRQTLSLALSTQTGLVDPSIGNNQWIIQPQYSISHWFFDNHFHFRSITYWQYGFAVDTATGTRKKNVIVPRIVLTGRLDRQLSVTLDLRPRIDITRHAFYSTLMFMLSRPIGNSYGVQLGYEFPLDSMATQKVEKAKLYISLSKTY